MKQPRGTAIRLPQQMLDDLKLHLELEGAYIEGISETEMVRRGLALLMYGSSDYGASKDLAVNYLRERYSKPQNQIVRGRVEEWAKTIDWTSAQVKDRYPKEMIAAMLEVTTKHSNLYDIKDKEELYHECPVEYTQPKCDKPPWEGAPRMSIEEIVSRYKNHYLIKWIQGDELKAIAVEMAFAMTTTVQHRSGVTEQMAMDLHKIFLEWKGGDDQCPPTIE